LRRIQHPKDALGYRIPTVSANPDCVEAEIPFLIAYGQDLGNHYRRAAAYCDKILKGARPRDLPVEQSELLSLVVSLKAARALGVTIPQSIPLRADRVHEQRNRFRDPRTGKWVRARYVATLAEIEARYREWEVVGPAEVRGDTPVQMFQPALPRLADAPLELQPHLATPPGIDATLPFREANSARVCQRLGRIIR
jgi:hypothetical protein